MEIRIQKDTSVSLHNQLVTQISMQIAAGLLRPGAKLPSIRGLSNKLNIHHNTCLAAYRELETAGLIEIRHGSGARVKVLESDQQPVLAKTTDLETLAEFFTREVRQRGYGWKDAQEALATAYEKQSNDLKELVFVDVHADILPVFQAELEQALQQPVRTAVLETLNPEDEQNSHFIVSRYHFQALKGRLKQENQNEDQLNQRFTVIEVGSGQQELGLIRQLSPGTMIGIVSASTIILRQAEAVIRAICGEEILVRTVLYGEEPLSEVEQVSRRAKVLFSDCLCLPKLQTLTSKRIQPIQTIQNHEIEKLKTLLG